jgi:hypothetical protein
VETLNRPAFAGHADWRMRNARRKTQAEHPHAEIKWAMRWRRCMLRGTAKVRGEWALVCAAFNVRRLWAHAAAG